MKSIHRRTFLQQTGILTLASIAAPSFANSFIEESKKIKVGLIGVGFRGQNHLDLLLKRKLTIGL